MASVEYLIKQFLSPDKKVLDLSNQVLGDKGAVTLAKSKQLKRVKRLALANNNISDEGAIAIANSEKFKNLTELDFYGNVISDDGVKAIAECPSIDIKIFLKLLVKESHSFLSFDVTGNFFFTIYLMYQPNTMWDLDSTYFLKTSKHHVLSLWYQDFHLLLYCCYL